MLGHYALQARAWARSDLVMAGGLEAGCGPFGLSLLQEEKEKSMSNVFRYGNDQIL